MKSFENGGYSNCGFENGYPLPILDSNYGDFRASGYYQKIEKLDWISRTIKYVSNNPNAKLLPRTFEDIVQYANEAFWTCNNQDCSPQNMQIARQLNNLLGSMTEYSFRSGDIAPEQFDSPSYHLAKAEAVKLIPDDINFYWGDHSVTFTEFFDNYPKSDFYINRKLFSGNYNYMPASLEVFCNQAKEGLVDEALIKRLETSGVKIGESKGSVIMSYGNYKLRPLSFYQQY